MEKYKCENDVRIYKYLLQTGRFRHVLSFYRPYLLLYIFRQITARKDVLFFQVTPSFRISKKGDKRGEIIMKQITSYQNNFHKKDPFIIQILQSTITIKEFFI